MVGGLDFLLSLTMVALLFALIYRYMPARRLAWGVVLGGGLLTAVLFDLGRWAIGIYLAHSTQPSHSVQHHPSPRCFSGFITRRRYFYLGRSLRRAWAASAKSSPRASRA